MDNEGQKKVQKKGLHHAKQVNAGFWKGFKNFISRGNILDLAVGVIIGTAFTAIINALVNGVIMQFISLLTGNADFTDLVWNINTGKVDEAGLVIYTAIRYGALIQAIINFIIIAFVIYLVVMVLIKRQVKKNIEAEEEARLKAIEDEEAAKLAEEERLRKESETSQEVLLLTEIRNYLKDLNKPEAK